MGSPKTIWKCNRKGRCSRICSGPFVVCKREGIKAHRTKASLVTVQTGLSWPAANSPSGRWFREAKPEGERCDRRQWRRQESRASGSGRNSVSELRTKNFGYRNRKRCQLNRTARIPQSFCKAKCQPPLQGGLL